MSANVTCGGVQNLGAKPGLALSLTAQLWKLVSKLVVTALGGSIHSVDVLFCFVLSAYLILGKLVNETEFLSCPHGVCKLSPGEVNCLLTVVVNVAIRA